MIIDNTYFKNEIYIPHAKPSVNDEVVAVDIELVSFINEYERDCLIKCLGFSLFNEFLAVLDSTKPNGLVDGVNAKWNDLLNGKTYANSAGVQVAWRGIRFKSSKAEGAKPDVSFLANYIYWFYEQERETSNSGIGHVKEKSKNAENVSASAKVIKAWRKFVLMVQGETKAPLIMENRYGYGIDWYQGGEEINLYRFINDMNATETIYANFTPKTWVTQNQFGI